MHNILRSAHLSVSVNGQSCGYFTCSRSVHQGDPLSPLLFCLAEDVLSRGLSLLVDQGEVKRIATLRSISPPSLVLFADDVIIFLQGNGKSLHALMNFMDEYALNSGQVVNKDKSLLFLGKFASLWHNRIHGVLGITVGTLPFTYLGVPIFQGLPKSDFFLPIADKVKCKLSTWKGMQLSQAGHFQLIESVIQSLLVYSFQIYAWPNYLLRQVQRWMNNFFWNHYYKNCFIQQFKTVVSFGP